MVPQMVQQVADEPGFLGKALGSLVGLDVPAEPTRNRDGRRAGREARAARKFDTGPLIKAHPGFRTARSVVLHRFGIESGYEIVAAVDDRIRGPHVPGARWGTRAMMQAQNAVNHGPAADCRTPSASSSWSAPSGTRRPLFGTGLIDAIPERAIEDAAKAKHAGFPEIAGRVSRLKDKRIGRFGWKAQTASLRRLRPDGLRGRAGPGGPRPSPGGQSRRSRTPRPRGST